MLLNRKIFIFIILIQLTACSSSSSENNEKNDGSLTLSKISGMWDISEQIGQDRDEKYIEITKYGYLRLYDYMGDSFSANSENCYIRSSIKIVSVGSDVFSYQNSSNTNFLAKLSDDVLELEFDNGSKKVGTKSSLLPTDLQPVCRNEDVEQVESPSENENECIGCIHVGDMPDDIKLDIIAPPSEDRFEDSGGADVNWNISH